MSVTVVVLAWVVLSPLLAIVVGRLLRGRTAPSSPGTAVLDEVSERRRSWVDDVVPAQAG